MEVKATVCAVVVTYNRKNLLFKCLEALLKQTRPIDAIYIIDNFSNDGTPEALKENGYITDLPPENVSEPWEKEFETKNLTDGKPVKIHYVRMNKNTGGAGGFYEGVKRGYERGYDWLWLMDDDAEPREDALEKLSKYFDNDALSALASSVVLTNGIISYNHRRSHINSNQNYPLSQKPLELRAYENLYVEIDMASFVGILVNRRAIEKIGYPRKEFFIHHDDVEYCIRLRQVGKILLIPDSVIIHKEASNAGIKKSFMGRKSLRTPYDKFWLNYYSNRNLVWLGRQYPTSKINFYLGLCEDFMKSIISVLIYDDNKIKRINFIINSYIDGLKGNFDNEKPKRILYKK
ncbi:MAG TPA: glycosyltransferase family 2 protein [Dictyoglomaceae bacterium]|nr:glycosyltransferase family 2 protein [Dictyoglomaceae bacterium]